jgi:hypothetical protein
VINKANRYTTIVRHIEITVAILSIQSISESKKKEPNVTGIQAKIISIGEINALNIDTFTSAYLKTNRKFTKAITKKLDTVAIGAP